MNVSPISAANQTNQQYKSKKQNLPAFNGTINATLNGAQTPSKVRDFIKFFGDLGMELLKIIKDPHSPFSRLDLVLKDMRAAFIFDEASNPEAKKVFDKFKKKLGDNADIELTYSDK